MQWAGEQSMFLTVVRPMLTWFEGLVYAVTPIAAFVLVMGPMGIKMAGKWLMLLLWIQFWMPVLAVVNLFVITGSEQTIAAMTEPVGSIAFMWALDSELMTWLSMGGMLASSTPAIALMLIYGSAVTATHMAGRLQGGDFVNEKIASPDQIGAAPLNQLSAAMSTGMQSGSIMDGAQQFMSNINMGQALTGVNSSTDSSAKTLTESAQGAVKTGLSQGFTGTNTVSQLQSLGRQVAAHSDKQVSAVAGTAQSIGQKHGFNQQQTEALTGLLALQASGQASIGAGGELAIGGKKMGQVVDFLNAAGGNGENPSLAETVGSAPTTQPAVIGSGDDSKPKPGSGVHSNVGVKAGASITGTSSSQGVSQTGTNWENALSDIKQVSGDQKWGAGFRDQLAHNLQDGKTDAFEEKLGMTNTSEYAKMAAEQRVFQEQKAETEGFNRQHGATGGMDGAHASELLANNPEQKDALRAQVMSTKDGRDNYQNFRAMTQGMFTDSNQGDAAALIKAASVGSLDDQRALLSAVYGAQGLNVGAVSGPDAINPDSNSGIPTVGPEANGVWDKATAETAPVLPALKEAMGPGKFSDFVKQQMKLGEDALEPTAIAASLQAKYGNGAAEVAAIADDAARTQASESLPALRSQVMRNDPDTGAAPQIFGAMENLNDFSQDVFKGLNNVTSSLGGAAVDGTEAAVATYDQQMEQMRQENPAETGGIAHSAVANSSAAMDAASAGWETLTNGGSLSDTFSTIKDSFNAKSAEYGQQANAGTQLENMGAAFVMAAAAGAEAGIGSFEENYAQLVEQNRGEIMELAGAAGGAMGLDETSQNILGQAQYEGILGRAGNIAEGAAAAVGIDLNTRSSEMEGYYQELVKQHTDVDGNVDQEFVDHQMDMLRSAPAAGLSFMSNELLSLGAYDSAQDRAENGLGLQDAVASRQ
tara:strand:- start:925 stop:3714 length:2790 start_codon:yes stop_codon:yes gene_type:complete